MHWGTNTTWIIFKFLSLKNVGVKLENIFHHLAKLLNNPEETARNILINFSRKLRFKYIHCYK